MTRRHAHHRPALAAGIALAASILGGAGVAAALWLLRIDFALLWGVLLFFLSLVPFIGIFLDGAPPVMLALAEFGLGRALLVIGGITMVNVAVENVVMPQLVGTSFSMAATIVPVSSFS